MKFFILGDSWGVGEYCLVNKQYESIPDTGLDYYLKQHGHSVTNISAGSAGNFGQLRNAYWTLKNNSNYDYIIWFHTESMRDIQEIIINDPEESAIQFPKFNFQNFNSGLDYIDNQNYKYAQAIADEYQIPFIVIGGHSPVNPIINNFSFAKYTIFSWLAELLELTIVPPKNTFNSWEKIVKILEHYKLDQKKFIIDHLEELEKLKKIQDLAIQSPLFPDNTHPSTQCYNELANRIIKIIS